MGQNNEQPTTHIIECFYCGDNYEASAEEIMDHYDLDEMPAELDHVLDSDFDDLYCPVCSAIEEWERVEKEEKRKK